MRRVHQRCPRLCAETWGSLMDLEGDPGPGVVGRGQYEGRGMKQSQGSWRLKEPLDSSEPRFLGPQSCRLAFCPSAAHQSWEESTLHYQRSCLLRHMVSRLQLSIMGEVFFSPSSGTGPFFWSTGLVAPLRPSHWVKRHLLLFKTNTSFIAPDEKERRL